MDVPAVKSWWGLAFLIVVIATGLLWCFVGVRARARAREHEWVPPSLRGANLSYAERTFRDRTRGIVARVDRAYMTADGYVLVEYKTRRRFTVYPSDIVELSAQRLALEGESGAKVSDIAYVAVKTPGSPGTRAVQVSLMPREKVLELRSRHVAIVDGRIEGQFARTPAICESCAYRLDCRGRA